MGAIGSIAAKIGCSGETLRQWVRQAERDHGLRVGPTSADQGPGAGGPRTAPSERNPAQGLGLFCDSGARPPLEAMIAFIDAHREVYGVELICRVLAIAPSTYHEHVARRRNPARLLARARQDGFLRAEIRCVWEENFGVYVTYVATWQGFVYVAFVIDACARRIVGWRVSRSAATGFVLDAVEQALYDRRPFRPGGLVHHSDSQYVSIRYTERLAEAGIEPSIGSVGDSYDNALAETVIGLFKTEVIRRCGPWRHAEAVEFATLEWVDWFNHRRLFELIGNIPPAEAEARYHAQIAGQAMVA
jgi:putative transposase